MHFNNSRLDLFLYACVPHGPECRVRNRESSFVNLSWYGKVLDKCKLAGQVYLVALTAGHKQ